MSIETGLFADLREALGGAFLGSRTAAKLDELEARLSSPLRVAVVGQIKAGKSTLMNALLGETLLPTGIEETTYNACWLRHGPRPQAVIHWGDDRPDEEIEIEALTRWCQRQGAPRTADDIRHIDIFAPIDLLRRIEIIDTPGLASSFGIDSAKTTSFLHILEQATNEETSSADAVVYVFKRGVHETDDAALTAFRRGAEGRVSPLNAVGVLAQIDRYWPGENDPVAAANRVIRGLMNKPQVRNALFDVLPISALLASVDDRVFRALADLASVPDAVFERAVTSAQRFRDDVGLNMVTDYETRSRLVETLGLYGIAHGRALVKSGGTSLAREGLLLASGVPALLALLDRHFGRRACLIKLLYGLVRLRHHAAQLADGSDERERILGEAWRRIIEKFVFENMDILRLDLLRSVYADPSDLTDAEIEDVCRAAGDRGNSLEERYGISDLASAEAVIAGLAPRVATWRARLNEARMTGATSVYIARSMCRLLEYEVNLARRTEGLS